MPTANEAREADREQVLERHLEAERSGDPAAILATFTHPRYEMVGNGRVYDGVDEVRRYLVGRARTFPDLMTEVIHLWHNPQVVAAELWLSGSYRGPIGDVGAAGRRFRVRTACSSCSRTPVSSACGPTSIPARWPVN